VIGDRREQLGDRGRRRDELESIRKPRGKEGRRGKFFNRREPEVTEIFYKEAKKPGRQEFFAGHDEARSRIRELVSESV